jgi:hypothetical protein
MALYPDQLFLLELPILFLLVSTAQLALSLAQTASGFIQTATFRIQTTPTALFPTSN